MSVEITAKMVADLRARTGAGLMACKKALSANNGDVDAAVMELRKKGEAKADEKSGRAASEGLVEQYIHMGGKVGVLLEINCETDFVAKTDEFKTLAKDICLHIAASSPVCVSREEVPADVLEKEREVAAGSVQGKPPEIVEKIVEGKLNKVYGEIVLLEQPFVKNPEISIQDLVKQTVAKLGENIVVRRFTRYQLGGE